MDIITVFYIKLFLNFILTTAIFGIVWKAHLFEKWQLNADKTVFAIGFLLFRLLPWIGIFLILNFDPRGDVPFFFYKAEHAKAGGFVYRDFWSYHAPIFSYIISIPLWIWHNPRSIVLLMVLMESAILWFTYKTYKPYRKDALLLSYLYWLLPATFMYIMIDGQEEVWFWGIGLMMWIHLLKKKENYETGLAILFAVALITLKVTFIFLLPPLLILVRKPVKMLAIMAAIGLPTVGIMYYFIGDLFLMPIQHTEQLMTPNLFSIFRPFIEMFVHIDETNSTLVNWFGLMFTILIPSIAAWKARHLTIAHALPGLFIMSYCCMMLFQASAPGAYVIAFLITVIFHLVNPNNLKDLFIILALGWLTVVQPFVNVYIGQPDYISFSMFSESKHVLDLILQVLNVACYIWILVRAWQSVTTTKTLVRI